MDPLCENGNRDAGPKIDRFPAFVIFENEAFRILTLQA